MAINDIFNSLTFGEVNSLDYGIYITGEGVFDAPERAVELVEVPGRNGSIDLDEGYWKNIEVTYTAGTFAEDQADFARKLGAFRNAVLSQRGYQRLTDTYNPGEYRLGLYASGLSVETSSYKRGGEFELVFNCKPQRYLLSGETEIAVSSGATVNNPTLYESRPLVEATGVGNVKIGESTINIQKTPLGKFLVIPGRFEEYEAEPGEEVDTLLMAGQTYPPGQKRWNQGDEIVIDEVNATFRLADDPGITVQMQTTLANGAEPEYSLGEPYATVRLKNLHFRAGSTEGDLKLVRFDFISHGTALFQATLSVNYYIQGELGMQMVARIQIRNAPEQIPGGIGKLTMADVHVYSTTLLSTGTVMIDTETGEAYRPEDDRIWDLNRYVSLGAELPKLTAGENEITYADTITNLKIIPRWWQL